MNLHLTTLLSLLLLELLSLVLMLPVLMGRDASRAARWSQGFFALQGLGWLALLLNEQGPSPDARHWLGALAMASLSASITALWLALGDWLGPRPGRRPMLAAPLLLGALVAGWPGHSAAFGADAAGLGLGLQMLMLVTACLWPRRSPNTPDLGVRGPAERVASKDRAWRALLGLSFLAQSGLTLARASFYLLAAANPADTFTWLLLMCSHVVLLATVLAVMVAWRGETELRLQRQAQTDALTGLCNRRAFGLRASEMIGQTRRHDEPLSLVMLDLDHFKRVNDEHGHAMGDRALALFAQCLQLALRQGDLAGRVGGEEFCAVLARSAGDGPQAMDQRLREVLHRRSQQELGFVLDYSAGWALLRHGDRNVEDLMRRADAALYEAKRSGRGRLCDEPGLHPSTAQAQASGADFSASGVSASG